MESLQLIQSKINLINDQIENLEQSGYFTDAEMEDQTQCLRSLRKLLEKKIENEPKRYNNYIIASCSDCGGLAQCAQEKGMSKQMHKEFLKLRHQGYVIRTISSYECEHYIGTLGACKACINIKAV